MVKVSIIVPIYNAQDYLKRCLIFLINQTLEDIEILLIDDGSTDKSGEIIKSYAKKDSRIKVFTQSNKGQGAARNLGIKEAKGEYLSFVDADDRIELNFCEEMYNEAILNNADIIASRMVVVDKKIKRNKLPKKKLYKTFEEKIKTIKNGSACDKIFKRKMIYDNNISFPEGVFWEDNLFIIKAFYYSNNYTITKKTAYNYCYHSNSTTHSKFNKEKLKCSLVKMLHLIVDFVTLEKMKLEDFQAIKNYMVDGFVSFEFLSEEKVFSKIPNILKNDKDFINKGNTTFYDNNFQRLCSMKNSRNKKYKILTIFLIPIRFKRHAK